MSSEIGTDVETGQRAWSIRRLFSESALLVFVIIFLFPIIFAITSSTKSRGEIFTSPPTLFGEKLNFSNYVEVFTTAPFLRYIVNSLVVALAGTIIVLIVSALAAYAFGVLKWKGREQGMLVYLGTIMIPQEVLVIPMFLLMQRFGWIDSYQALILPWAFGAFGTFLLRQFFMSLPYELVEAARIDGCGHMRTFLRIILPLAKPAMGVLAVWTFVTYWNSFLWPLIAINDVRGLGTIPLGLQTFFGEHGAAWNLILAASVVSILPTILLVIALQKHLVKGIAMAGLGGR